MIKVMRWLYWKCILSSKLASHSIPLNPIYAPWTKVGLCLPGFEGVIFKLNPEAQEAFSRLPHNHPMRAKSIVSKGDQGLPLASGTRGAPWLSASEM